MDRAKLCVDFDKSIVDIIIGQEIIKGYIGYNERRQLYVWESKTAYPRPCSQSFFLRDIDGIEETLFFPGYYFFSLTDKSIEELIRRLQTAIDDYNCLNKNNKDMEKAELKILSDDKIDIKIEGNTYYCEVSEETDGFFLDVNEADNDFLFKKVGITDIFNFSKEILGYKSDSGIFPYCKSEKDVIRLSQAVVDYYNKTCATGGFSLKKRKNIKFNFNL